MSSPGVRTGFKSMLTRPELIRKEVVPSLDASGSEGRPSGPDRSSKLQPGMELLIRMRETSRSRPRSIQSPTPSFRRPKSAVL